MSEPQKRLLDLGWSAHMARAFAPYESFHRPARVSGTDEAGAVLVGDAGAVRASYGGALLHECAHDRSAAPALGDWAAVREWPDDRVTIEALLPRRAVIRRQLDPAGPGEVVAAHVDVVVLTGPPDAALKLPGEAELVPADMARLSGGRTLALLGKASTAKTALIDRLAGTAASDGAQRFSGRGRQLIVVPGHGVLLDVE